MSTIPVSLTQEQFEQYIRPSLSVAKQGYECSIPFSSERTFAWIDKFRALLVRFDRKAAHVPSLPRS